MMMHHHALLKPNAARALHFIENAIGATIWNKPESIVRAVFSPLRNVYVHASTSVSKTKTAADIAIAWMISAPGRTAITTAPTGRQVKQLLWKEIRASNNEAAARGFHIANGLLPKAPLWQIEQGWEMIGFSSSDSINFQGYHSRNGTLVIIDEATGVKNETFDALEATLVGEHDKMLCLANPTISHGRFFEQCRKPSPGSEVIHISAFDSPNVIQDSTVIPGLVTKHGIEKIRDRYGEESPMWRTRVLGMFPSSNNESLVPETWLSIAFDLFEDLRHDWKLNVRESKPFEVCVAYDLARFGGDEIVGVSSKRYRMRRPHEVPGDSRHGSKTIDVRVCDWMPMSPCDTMVCASNIRTAAAMNDAREIRVDADGLGAGVYDRLAHLGESVIGMRGGRRANRPDRFVNARSEWLWSLRESLDPNSRGPSVAIRINNELLQQATSMRWSQTSDGRIKVQSKDDWRKENPTAKNSPDELDAIAMALCEPPMSAEGNHDRVDTELWNRVY